MNETTPYFHVYIEGKIWLDPNDSTNKFTISFEKL